MVETPGTLTLPFLGERTYLHGTTLFEALWGRTAGASDLSFKIARRIMTDRVELRDFDHRPEGAPAASLTFLDAQAREHHVQVEPLRASRLIAREAFDERRIVDLASFSKDAVRLAQPSPFSTVKTIVALNKALLTRMWVPPGPGQWLFTRLDLQSYPSRFEDIAITYRTRMSFAVVASDISIDGAALGRVVFSWRDL